MNTNSRRSRPGGLLPRRKGPDQTAAHSFVFGSSTPRELSHITNPKVSKRERLIDTKIEAKPVAEKRDIVFYMRQARSIEGRGPDRKSLSRNYAFGSSTPRSLSHLSNLAKAQRVYDAKVERNDEPWFERKEQGNSRWNNHRSLSRESRQDEDALSEPDLVQDRQMDFDMGKAGRERRKNEEEEGKEAGKGGSSGREEESKSKQSQQRGPAKEEQREKRKEEGEEEGENVPDGAERADKLALEATMNHRAVSREVGEGEEGTPTTMARGGLHIRLPDVQMERADPVQVEEEGHPTTIGHGREDRGPSPVSDF